MTDRQFAVIGLAICAFFIWQSVLVLQQDAALDRLDQATRDLSALIKTTQVTP